MNPFFRRLFSYDSGGMYRFDNRPSSIKHGESWRRNRGKCRIIRK